MTYYIFQPGPRDRYAEHRFETTDVLDAVSRAHALSLSFETTVCLNRRYAEIEDGETIWYSEKLISFNGGVPTFTGLHVFRHGARDDA